MRLAQPRQGSALITVELCTVSTQKGAINRELQQLVNV